MEPDNRVPGMEDKDERKLERMPPPDDVTAKRRFGNRSG